MSGDLKKTIKSNQPSQTEFKFKSYTSSIPSAKPPVPGNSRSFATYRTSPTTTTKHNSEYLLNSLIHSKSFRNGKVNKQKLNKNRINSNTNLECFNLLEKEKFRQLIEQNENYRPVNKTCNGNGSVGQRNVYKHFIHSVATVTRDDIQDPGKNSLPSPNLAARISAGYTRRISLSLDSKPESLSTNDTYSYFNKYSSTSINKNLNNKPKEVDQTIEIIDISNITDKLKTKQPQKRPGIENDIERTFQKEKKDYYALYQTQANYSKLNRSMNEFEKSIEDRLKNNQSIIEAVLSKSQSRIEAGLLMEEERYKMKKRQRQEKDLIERELALKFTQQLHVDSDKFTSSYLEQDLVAIENDFPDLTDLHNDQIDSALISNPKDEVLVTAFSISICRKDIQTLYGLNWLNDEVINFYMTLICERSKNGESPKVHAFTTFFYPKLIRDGYSALRRWTRKTDIFSFDLILVPVHLGLHWTLAVIDFSVREVRYYDSMNGNNSECLRALRGYLADEYRDKKAGQELDLSDWNFMHNKNLPQQMNGSDCGMFACKYAEYLSRGKTTFNFNQSHMPYFRRRMIWEILNTKLM